MQSTASSPLILGGGGGLIFSQKFVFGEGGGLDKIWILGRSGGRLPNLETPTAFRWGNWKKEAGTLEDTVKLFAHMAIFH